MSIDLNTLDLEKINLDLRSKSPEEIIEWALSLNATSFATTSFGPNSAALLKMTSDVDAELPIVWVDHGYNVKPAYVAAEEIMQQLPLNMKIYNPKMSAERRNSIMGGIPSIDEPDLHDEFTRQVKLEPFAEAMTDLNAQIWITGIRRDETEHRQSLDIVSLDNRGMLKVAPIFYWSNEQVEDFMSLNQLPTTQHYFDPTKVMDGRECGLHTAA